MPTTVSSRSRSTTSPERVLVPGAVPTHGWLSVHASIERPQSELIASAAGVPLAEVAVRRFVTCFGVAPISFGASGQQQRGNSGPELARAVGIAGCGARDCAS